MHKFLTIESLLEFGKSYLRNHNISNYKQESLWILLNVINQNFTWWVSNKNYTPTPQDVDNYLNMIYKRSDHIPLQLILGVASFYGRDFTIYPDVFIPRQDTEVIIDICKKKNFKQPLIYVRDQVV